MPNKSIRIGFIFYCFSCMLGYFHVIKVTGERESTLAIKLSQLISFQKSFTRPTDCERYVSCIVFIASAARISPMYKKPKSTERLRKFCFFLFCAPPDNRFSSIGQRVGKSPRLPNFPIFSRTISPVYLSERAAVWFEIKIFHSSFCAHGNLFRFSFCFILLGSVSVCYCKLQRFFWVTSWFRSQAILNCFLLSI